MSYQLVLKIEADNLIELSLRKEGKKVDKLEWSDKNSLSRFLLAKIDHLLIRNGMGLDKISEYKIISGVPKKYTTYRIADVTFKSLALAKQKTLC